MIILNKNIVLDVYYRFIIPLKADAGYGPGSLTIAIANVYLSICPTIHSTIVIVDDHNRRSRNKKL